MHAFTTAHRNITLAVGAIIFILAWGLPTLVIPFAGDQSWFALGARTILNGDQLYVDFHDQKSPFIYFLYAIPQALAGDGYEAVRVFDLLNTLLAMGGVFLLALRFLPERAAVLSAAVYGFVYLTAAGSDGLGETENFIAPPLLLGLAIYPVASGRHTLAVSFAAGVLLGLAFGLKFSVALFVLFLPLMELMLRDRQTWSLADAVKRLSFAAVGFLLVQAIWIGYLVATGILDAFLDIQTNYTVPYQNLRWRPDDWSLFRLIYVRSEQWLSTVWYLALPAWIGLMLVLASGPRKGGYILGLLTGAAILSVWWQSKFFAYHWLITLPFLAILMGYAMHVGIEHLRGLTSRWQQASLVAAGILGIGIILAMPLVSTYDGYHRLYERFVNGKDQAAIDAEYSGALALHHELVDFVRANSDPDEGFVIWGTWPQSLLQANRPSPTNFITSPPLRAEWSPDKWRAEYVESLTTTPPRFFAVADGDWQPWLTGTDRTSRDDFCNHYPELRALIEREFVPVLNNGLFVLYDRDAVEPSATVACP